MRRDLVARQKASIDEHNQRYEAGEENFTYALNDYSDTTEEEKCQRWYRPMYEERSQ